LSWNTHVGHAVAKASRMLGVVRRNLAKCPEKLKETAYSSLVRPHVEYASVIWDPHQVNNKEKVEKIQRKAARFVKSNYTMTAGTVTSLLKQLGWKSLEDRRADARLTLFYKIVNKEVDVPRDRYLAPVTRISRHTNTKNYKHHQTKLLCYKYSFFPRTLLEWNELPESTVQAPSIQAFKNHLHHQ